MSWFAPVLVVLEDRFGSVTPDVLSAWPAVGGLGSSVAGPWFWDNAPVAANDLFQPAPRQPTGVRLSAPAGTVRRMADAARALGRSESDVWVEAAREWLQRHEPNAPEGRAHSQIGSGYIPDGAPEPATQSILSIARRARQWRAIDDVLDTLRDEPLAPQCELIPA